MQAGTLDVALNQRRLQLNTLVEIQQCGLGVTLEIRESGSQVKSKGFVFTQVSELQGLLKSRSSLLIAITSLQGHCKQTLAELALARFFAQIHRLIEAFGQCLGAEALEIVRNEGRARELLALRLNNGLSFPLSNLLQESFQSNTADLVGEAVNDAAGSKVKKSLAELLQVFVCNSSPVQGFDVLAVHGESGTGIFDNLLPLRQNVVAGGTVRVEDWVGLAENGLSVELNGFVVVLGAIRLVSSSLELGCVSLPCL